MTICIAIKTIEGNIVGFTDRLIQDENISKSIEGQPFSKITVLDKCAVLMSSGDFTLWDEVIHEYKKILSKETLEKGFDRSYIYLLPQAIKMVLEVKQKANLNKEEFKLEHSIAIIAGIDSEEYIFTINHEGRVSSCTASGHISIGSGYAFADSYLWSGSFINQLSLEQALYEGYKAKKISEQDNGVGKATDIFILTRSGIDISNKYIDILDEIYNKEMQQIDELHQEILKTDLKRLI